MISLILCIIVAYYSDIMLYIANKIENNNKIKKIDIQSFGHICKILFGKKFEFFVKMLMFFNNEFGIIVNTTNLSKFLF